MHTPEGSLVGNGERPDLLPIGNDNQCFQQEEVPSEEEDDTEETETVIPVVGPESGETDVTSRSV